jgi:hypothetical protein
MTTTDPTTTLAPAQSRLLEALRAADGQPRTNAQLVAWVGVAHGHWMARETAARSLSRLAALGLAAFTDRDAGTPRAWMATRPDEDR